MDPALLEGAQQQARRLMEGTVRLPDGTRLVLMDEYDPAADWVVVHRTSDTVFLRRLDRV